MDGIFGIGPLELFLIAVIALIVLGPERLPHALREVAKTLRKVRELTSEFTNQFGDELQALDEINPRKILSDMVDPTKPLPGDPKPGATNSAAAPSKTTASGQAAAKPAADKPVTDKPAQAKANAFVASQAATEQARATKAAKEAKAKEEAEALAAASAAAADGVINNADTVEDASSTSATLELSDGVLTDNSIMPPELHTNGAPEEAAQLPVFQASEPTDPSEAPQPIAADESA